MKEINKYKSTQSSGILLNANESSNNLSEAIINEIQEAITNISFNRYPEDNSSELLDAYSKYVGVDSSCIMAGNGSDEMLGLLIGLNISDNKKLYTLERDFGMFNYYTSMHGGEVVTFPLDIEEEFDADKFIKNGIEEDVNLIMFSNPNNPTGKIIAKENIKKVLEGFRDKIVVVDEAYVEFSKYSMISEINNYPNLVVTRTLSKAFGLAGIRCGFMVSNKLLMDKLKPYKVPYNLNTLTQKVATICLQHYEEVKESVEVIKNNRDKLYQDIMDLNLKDITVYPSNANYLFGVTSNKEKLLKAMEAENIVIRNYEDNSFRITIGNEDENELVLNVLKNL